MRKLLSLYLVLVIFIVGCKGNVMEPNPQPAQYYIDSLITREIPFDKDKVIFQENDQQITYNVIRTYKDFLKIYDEYEYETRIDIDINNQQIVFLTNKNNYILANDIAYDPLVDDVSSIDISYYRELDGIFDGNGYSITNIFVPHLRGETMFSRIGKNGTVKNVVFKGAALGSDMYPINYLLAHKNYGIIRDVVNTVDNLSEASLVSLNQGLISNCVNFGNIGIIDHNIYGRQISVFAYSNQSGGIIENCINYGTIQGITVSSICFYNNEGSVMRNCVNYGLIIYKSESDDKDIFMGKIDKGATIIDVYNFGETINLMYKQETN